MDYIIRNINDKLWHKVKIKAVTGGVTIKDVIIDLLAQWVAGKVATSKGMGPATKKMLDELERGARKKKK